MKKVFLMMIVCCLIATTQGFSQEVPIAAEMTFEKLVHDFDTIPLNGVAEYEFKFTNTGNEPLIIQACQSTCGCTVPICPRERPVLPGETGTIKVQYTTTYVAGPINRYFSVISNAKNSPVRLHIVGQISSTAADTAAN